MWHRRGRLSCLTVSKDDTPATFPDRWVLTCSRFISSIATVRKACLWIALYPEDNLVPRERRPRFVGSLNSRKGAATESGAMQAPPGSQRPSQRRSPNPPAGTSGHSPSGAQSQYSPASAHPTMSVGAGQPGVRTNSNSSKSHTYKKSNVSWYPLRLCPSTTWSASLGRGILT